MPFTRSMSKQQAGIEQMVGTSWALPVDVTRHILGLVGNPDVVRFEAVCKDTCSLKVPLPRTVEAHKLGTSNSICRAQELEVDITRCVDPGLRVGPSSTKLQPALDRMVHVLSSSNTAGPMPLLQSLALYGNYKEQHLELYASCGDVVVSNEVWQLFTLTSLSISMFKNLPTPATVNVPALQKLSLYNCQCSDIDMVTRLTSLQQLELWNCPIQTLPSNLSACLVELQLLTVRCCDLLEAVPPGLDSLESLHTLAIGLKRWFGKIPTVPAVGQITTLTRLEYSSTEGMPPSSIWQQLTGLKELHFVGMHQATSLCPPSGSVAALQGLLHLEINRCHRLTGIPASVCELSSLRVLVLCEVSLTSLPEELGQLGGSLTHLIIESCAALHSLPASFTCLTSLQTLEIRTNAKLAAGLDIRSMRQLEHLFVAGCRRLKRFHNKTFQQLNQLKTLIVKGVGHCLDRSLDSSCFTNLTSLTKLSMDMVYARHPSAGHPLAGISMLQALQRVEIDAGTIGSKFSGFTHDVYGVRPSLSFCQSWKSLPEVLAQLRSVRSLSVHAWSDAQVLLSFSTFDTSRLTQLHISGCGWNELPSGMGSLSALKVMKVVGCERLKHLPADLQGLTELEELVLDSCRDLLSLPASISHARGLKFIKLRKCWLLEQVPTSWGGLPALQRLDISDCPRLAVLPTQLQRISRYRHPQQYLGVTGRLYPLALAIAEADALLGSPQYDIAPAPDPDDGCVYYNVERVLDEVQVEVEVEEEASAAAGRGSRARGRKKKGKAQTAAVRTVVKLVTYALVKWKGYELDMLGGWQPLEEVQHTTAWEEWSRDKEQAAWFTAVAPAAAADAYAAAMKGQ